VSTFAVPGAELAIELSDEGGAAVVQLHGLTSSRSRDRLLDLDLGRGLSGTRLLRYDARGHGRSTGRPEPTDYRWDVLADDLLRLIDHVFPGERVHGVGPSMGAATLLHAAVREPDRFNGLTLLLPPTAWATRVAKGDDYRAAARVVEEQGLEVFLEAGRLAPVPPATEGLPETRPDVDVGLLPALFRGAASTDLPSPHTVATITVPTTILAWIDDPSHPLSTAETLLELLPSASLEVASTRTDVETWPAILAADVARRSVWTEDA